MNGLPHEKLDELVLRLALECEEPDEVVERVLDLPDVAPWVAEDANRRVWLEGEVLRTLPPAFLKR